MIYSLYFCINGVTGPGGYANESLSEVISFARPIVETALDQLDDLVNEWEWFDPSGEEANPYELLHSDDTDQFQDILSQISDLMKAKGYGWIDIQTHDDLFYLANHHDVVTWAPEPFKHRLKELRKAYLSLVEDLSNEWFKE
jgi:hypothetical protein